METRPVAISSTIGCGEDGTPMAIGLVPIIALRPP